MCCVLYCTVGDKPNRCGIARQSLGHDRTGASSYYSHILDSIVLRVTPALVRRLDDSADRIFRLTLLFFDVILQLCPIVIPSSYLRQLSPSTITTCYAPHFAADQNKHVPVMEKAPRHINLPGSLVIYRPTLATVSDPKNAQCPSPLSASASVLRDFLTFAPSTVFKL